MRRTGMQSHGIGSACAEPCDRKGVGKTLCFPVEEIIKNRGFLRSEATSLAQEAHGKEA